jgi:hypothetical protein
MSNVTIQSLKTLAKSLRSDTVSHSQALEIVAKQNGFKDWNAAVAMSPPEPSAASFDSFVRRFDGIAPKYDVLRPIPFASNRPEYDEVVAEIDAVFRDMQDAGRSWQEIAACMRYVGYHLSLPLLVRSPNLARFTLRHRDHIMSVNVEENFLRFFPHLAKPALTVLSYGVLVQTVQSIVAEFPGIKHEEVIAKIDERHPNSDYRQQSVVQIMLRGPGWKNEPGWKKS